jgi:hypothetical protein
MDKAVHGDECVNESNHCIDDDFDDFRYPIYRVDSALKMLAGALWDDSNERLQGACVALEAIARLLAYESEECFSQDGAAADVCIHIKHVLYRADSALRMLSGALWDDHSDERLEGACVAIEGVAALLIRESEECFSKRGVRL